MSFWKIGTCLVSVLIILIFTSGCLSYCFGDTAYDGSNLNIQVQNNGDGRFSTVQVTVYSLKDFRQKEYTKSVSTVFLDHGLNDYSVPVELEKGSYKLYLYVLEDGKRASAEIKNIVV